MVKETEVGSSDVLSRAPWSTHARQILSQYNQTLQRDGFRGPHFVTYEQGEFLLRSFGAYSDDRYSFECRPEIVSWQDEPLWIFVVMC